MRIREVKDKPSKLSQIKKFEQWACKKLGITDIPPIKYSDDVEIAKDNRTFGSTKSDGTVWVHMGNRTVADIARTLVHELIHVVQFKEGTATDDMDEDQRQYIEDEANAIAGRIMREYGKLDSKIYESKKQSRPCCTRLKKMLLKYKKTGYKSIDKMMNVVANRYDITAEQLHDYWQQEYKMSPDRWIKNQLKILRESKITDDQSQALDSVYIIPDLPNSDFYKQYRFGVALAGAKGRKYRDQEPPDLGASSEWGESLIVAGYAGDIGEYIDDALRSIGMKGSAKVLTTTKRSEEPKSIPKGSPVIPFKGY
jgi:Zn-dependent peptidase ImmA (M78 family)